MSKLTLTLSAQPNADFASTSHRGSVRIDPHEVEVASIAEAIRLFITFVADNNLGAGNIGGDAGLIKKDGVPPPKSRSTAPCGLSTAPAARPASPTSGRASPTSARSSSSYERRRT